MRAPRSMSADEMLEYLQTHVYRDGDCLIWAGPVFRKGLPRANWNGRGYMARRLLFTLLGKNPGSRSITDSCGARLCMNRAHLSAVQPSVCIQKAIANGTWPTGALVSMSVARGKAAKAKLPITEARTVMRLRAEGNTLRSIGDRYGVQGPRVAAALKAWTRAGAV